MAPTGLIWEPPTDMRAVTAIDAHTAGEPLRVITGGVPPIPGETMLEKRRFAQDHLDAFRRSLMWEPRGHADMYGALITEPVTPDGDLGVLFLHNEGFSTMCGHGVIALAKVVFDAGLIVKEGDAPVLKMDTPAGRVTATARREKGRVKSVSFLNVPSFLYREGLIVSVPGLGVITCDIAFGGAFYAFCKAGELGVRLEPSAGAELIRVGKLVKSAVMDCIEIAHPEAEDLGFLYGVIFVGPAVDPLHHSRNVCVFADGEVDRSPTGTGVSARAAIHHARGELRGDETITIESLLGTCFDVRVAGTAQCGGYAAVIPEVTGRAHIVGQSRFCFDPDDPLSDGFLIR